MDSHCHADIEHLDESVASFQAATGLNVQLIESGEFAGYFQVIPSETRIAASLQVEHDHLWDLADQAERDGRSLDAGFFQLHADKVREIIESLTARAVRS